MNFRRFGRAAAALLLMVVAGTACAVPVRYHFTWSSAAFQNNARATGYIVFESTLLPNPVVAETVYTVPSAAVLDLSLTITGATVGNGTYPYAAFRNVVWSTGGATLDLSREVVGQTTPGGPWGTPNGTSGDFNLFTTSIATEPNQAAGAYPRAPQGAAPGPQGFNYFTLSTSGQTGDRMLLTSFAPGGAAPSVFANVPATNPAGLAALAGLLALAGVFAARRYSR